MFNEKYRLTEAVPMFGIEHIISLLFCIALITAVFLLRNYFKSHPKTDRIFCVIMASLLILMEIAMYCYHVSKNQFDNYFSLHLCSITVFLTGAAVLFNNAKVMKVICFWAVIGAVLSLIVLDTSYYPPHYVYIEYISSHSFFLVLSLHYLFTGKITLKYKDMYISGLYLTALAAFVLVMDLATGKNWMFLRALPDEAKVISDALGLTKDFTVLPLFILFIFIMFNLVYIAYKYMPRIKKNKETE